MQLFLSKFLLGGNANSVQATASGGVPGKTRITCTIFDLLCYKLWPFKACSAYLVATWNTPS